MINRRVFTVSQVNRYIRRMLEDDSLLSGILIEGELSNVNIHSSGHIYFSLKDEDASINAVMFKSNASSLGFEPRSGMKAVAIGYISLYEKTGLYQLYAEVLEPAGAGAIQAAFEQLRDRLIEEGLFDEARKKPIPAFARSVTVITSSAGAAVHDILRTIKNKNKYIKITLIPVLVQGSEAPDEIVKAIQLANGRVKSDVIILGRGGGSAEDLQAFNEETVARAISSSAIPVITGIGHETDFTISDFISDRREATPTAAAEAAVFDIGDVTETLNEIEIRLHKSVQEAFLHKKRAFDTAVRSRFTKRPLDLVQQRSAYLYSLDKNLNKSMAEFVSARKTRLDHSAKRLNGVSPYSVWKRGYSTVSGKGNRLVSSVRNIGVGDEISIRFIDGTAGARVTEVNIFETRGDDTTA